MGSSIIKRHFYASDINVQKSDFQAHYDKFGIDQGEITLVIGPSGGGKTTLLRQCSLIDLPKSGNISIGDNVFYNGKNNMENREKLWNELSFVFQEFFLWPHLTALENIEMPLKAVGRSNSHVKKIVDRLGLAGLEKKLIHELSAGQQQRFAIARALAKTPNFLFCDEITSSLDNEQIHFLAELLLEQLNEGVGIALITHHLGLANHFLEKRPGSNFVFIDNGKIVEKGGKLEFNSPKSDRLKQFLQKKYS